MPACGARFFPAHSSILFRDGEKTVHLTVCHQRSFAYRIAVSIIEPAGRNHYHHTSMVDMIEEAGQSLDGLIEQASKDEISIANGRVAGITRIRIGKRSAQRLFERALDRFSTLTDDYPGTLVIK